MFSRGAVAVFVLVVAEILVFRYAAGLLGVAPVIWVSLAGLVIGFGLIRRNLSGLARRGRQALESDRSAQGSAGDDALLVLSGLLLVIPGLLTGALGVLGLIPPVRALVRTQMRHRTEAWVSRGIGVPRGLDLSFSAAGSPFGRRDVLDVDLNPDNAAADDAQRNGNPSSTPPQLY